MTLPSHPPALKVAEAGYLPACLDPSESFQCAHDIGAVLLACRE
jgi:hypothetical protein